jgi:class 3 adenylate cyclase/DNA-binding winged helix-turn-helix (wHTH) protein/tetratricopeptide (TPR) repeat protein
MLYVFGDYELDTRLYELRHAGQPSQVEPQVFNVLTYLIQHRDHVVTKEELLDHLWPDQFVGEAVLSTRVMEARKAVGDSGRTQRVIKTVRGRGYRFVASVVEHGVTSAAVGKHVEPEAQVGTSIQTRRRLPQDEDAERCGTCSHVNRVDARFCNACGVSLEARCPTCRQANPSGSQFCSTCGHTLARPVPSALMPRFAAPVSYTPQHLAEQILMTRRVLAGERKQVTILLCGIANASALAERLGAEAMYSLLSAFFELALGEVHRVEGTINQFLGDGFMALFGAPIAHEDHARRAVLAAVGIRRRLSEGLTTLRPQSDEGMDVRMGLHTGQVVVGTIGDDLRTDYTAVGDTTHTAARLHQAATSGQIIISEATYRLVSSYCTTHALGVLSLQGKAAPISAWEVRAIQATRTRLEAAAERGLTPFVGREPELQRLHACFAQARAGHGQMVLIVGEPAIGKSRLLLEFRRQIGPKAAWLEGHALAFGRSIAFHPVIDLLKRICGIADDDSETTIIEKMTQAVERLGEDLRPSLPYLRYLLAVDPGDAVVRTMDPQWRRAELFDALRRFILRAADEQPQVLVFEDLHWVDEATEAFLAFLADSIPAGRVLCLCTYRPDYAHPFGERTYYTRLVLPALSPAESMRIAQAMLATEALPEEVRTLILQKAEGNPFFVEEVVKSLQESGSLERMGHRHGAAKPIGEVGVPGTVQDVLMARIDRLEDPTKRTLQLAAVIGRTFSRHLLDRLAGDQAQTEASLQALKASELIYETPRVSELTYVFKHALIQEVTYNALLERRRQELHGHIGQAIESLYADHLAEQYETLAYHFIRGQAWHKALAYLLKAAAKAAHAFATREALTLYDQALEVATSLGDVVTIESLMTIRQVRANLYIVSNDFARACAENEHLLSLARQANDQERQEMALAGMGMALMYAQDFTPALAYAQQVLAMDTTADVQPAVALSYLTTGVIHVVTARLPQAKPEIDQAIAISRLAGNVRQHALSLVVAGWLRNLEGEYASAVRFTSDGVRMAQEHNLPLPLVRGLFMYGLALTGKGDYDEALATFETGITLAEKVGDAFHFRRLLNSLGWLYSECGDVDRALALNRQSADEARKRGEAETAANADLNLADIFLAQGELNLAQECLDGVYHLVHDPATSDWMKWRYSTHLFTTLGALWLARGEPGKAQECVDRGLTIARRTHARKYLVTGWRLQGQIALARRQWDEAEAWLQQALGLAHTIGNPTQLWKTHFALGQFHTEAKRATPACQAYRAAGDVLDQVRAKLHNPNLRQSFESSAKFKQVYDLSRG